MASNDRRVQTDLQLSPEGLNVVARPVDTAVAVRQPQRSNNLTDLANALKEVTPSIEAYLGEELEQYSEEEMAKGRQEAIRLALDYKAAVEKGDIRPDQSPVFVQGYKEQLARLKGIRMEQQAKAAYSTFEGKDSDNPEDFQNFLKSQFGTAIDDEQDETVKRYLLPEINRIQANLGQVHAAYTGQRIYNQVLENSQAEISEAIDSEVDAALREGRAIDVGLISQNMNVVNSRARFMGVSGTDLNKAYVDILTTKAKQTGRTEILDALDQPRADGTPGPGRTAYGREQTQQARDSIFSKNIQLDNYMYQKEERAKKRNSDIILGGKLRQFMNTELPPEERFALSQPEIDAISAYNPELLQSLYTARNSMQSAAFEASTYEEPNDIAQIEYDIIHEKRGPEYVMASIEAGFIRNPATVSRLLGIADRMANSSGNVLSSVAVRQTMQAIDKALDPMNFAQYDTELTGQIRNMQNTYMQEMLEFEEQNPQATALQILKRSNEVAQEIGLNNALQGKAVTMANPTAPAATALPNANKAGEENKPVNPFANFNQGNN